MGLITGRKAFQRPMKEGVELLNAIQDVYLCASSTATRSSWMSAAARDRVRFIGMDTPESVKPGTPVQCFALKASAFNKHAGRRAAGAARARTSRPATATGACSPTSTAEPDGLFVNEELVRQGLRGAGDVPAQRALPATRSRPGARARGAAGRGLWNAC